MGNPAGISVTVHLLASSFPCSITRRNYSRYFAYLPITRGYPSPWHRNRSTARVPRCRTSVLYPITRAIVKTNNSISTNHPPIYPRRLRIHCERTAATGRLLLHLRPGVIRVSFLSICRIERRGILVSASLHRSKSTTAGRRSNERTERTKRTNRGR